MLVQRRQPVGGLIAGAVAADYAPPSKNMRPGILERRRLTPLTYILRRALQIEARGGRYSRRRPARVTKSQRSPRASNTQMVRVLLGKDLKRFVKMSVMRL